MKIKKTIKRGSAVCLAAIAVFTGAFAQIGIQVKAATEKASVSYDKVYQYSADGLGSMFTRHYRAVIDGDTATAYCLEPSKYPPGNGSYTVRKQKASSRLAKVLYYGSKASNQAGTNYFDSKSYEDVLKKNKYAKLSSGGEFVIVHLAASKANGSSDWSSGISAKAKNIVNDFMAWIDGMPEVPDTDVYFTKGGEPVSELQARKTIPEFTNGDDFGIKNSTDTFSQAFAVRCAPAQTITMTLPDDVRLIRTDGEHKITAVSEYGAVVKGINKGDADKTVCYLSTKASMASSVIKIKGSKLDKNYTAYKLTKQGSSSGLQSLGMIVPSDQDAKDSMKIRWGEEKGKFALEKREAGTGYAICGAVYGLFGDSNCTNLIGTFPATGSDGRSILENITITQNEYYIKEISAPLGVVLNTEVYLAEPIDAAADIVWDFSADTTNQALLVWENFMYGSVEIYKKDAETGEMHPQGAALLSKAEYGVYADRDIYYPGTDQLFASKDTEIQAGKTSDESKLIFTGLLPGDYYVKEKNPPKGYLMNDQKYPFAIAAEANATESQIPQIPVVTASDPVIRGDISLYKFRESDKEIKEPLEGITFRITSQTNHKTWDIVTDKNGFATTKGLNPTGRGTLPFDVYTVEETAGTPEELKKIDPLQVEITDQDNDVTKTYFLEDQVIKTPVTVVKKDAETQKTIPVAGTEFQLLDKDKNVIKMKMYYPSEKIYETFQTDETGSFTFPDILQAGVYYLKETRAPKGYLRGELLEFHVKESGDYDRPLVVCYEDDPAKGCIHLQKTDSDTQELIAGAVYEVTAAEDIVTPDGTVHVRKGETADTMVTDKKGTAQSKKLYPGNYLVKEISAPPGFVCDTKEYPVSLEYKDQETPIVHTYLQTMDKPVELKIKKTKAGTQEPVEGVKFKIWNKGMGSASEEPDRVGESAYMEKENRSENNGEVGVDIDREMGLTEILTTDKNGMVSVKYLAPGTYCIQEAETLPGFLLDETVHEVTVDAEGRINGKDDFELILENEYTQIIKTSARDKETQTNRSYAKDAVTIIDTVEFRNLIPGKTYHLEGTAMDQQSGKELTVNGIPVKSSADFTAQTPDGTAEVIFTFSASGLEGKKTVIFEELYLENTKIAAHADIKDEDQTVEFCETPGVPTEEKKTDLQKEKNPGKTKEPEKKVKEKQSEENSKKRARTVKTGDTDVFFYIILIGVAGAVLLGIPTVRKRKEIE